MKPAELRATLYELKHDPNTDWDCEVEYLLGIVDALATQCESDIRIARAQMEAYHRRDLAKIRKEYEQEIKQLQAQIAELQGETSE